MDIVMVVLSGHDYILRTQIIYYI